MAARCGTAGKKEMGVAERLRKLIEENARERKEQTGIIVNTTRW